MCSASRLYVFAENAAFCDSVFGAPNSINLSTSCCMAYDTSRDRKTGLSQMSVYTKMPLRSGVVIAQGQASHECFCPEKLS